MRTDPRAACTNAKELKTWAFVHDAIAHPFMALTNWSAVSLRFHDWTSHRAWPRKTANLPGACVHVAGGEWGYIDVMMFQLGFWQADHPNISHTTRVNAQDAIEAAEKVEALWADLYAQHGTIEFKPFRRSLK